MTKSIGHVAERLDPGSALALAGGVAIYLAGVALFRRVVRIPRVGYRAAAAVAVLATVVLGIYAAAGVRLVCLVLILVVTLVAEARTGQTDFAVPSTVTDAPARR